MAILLFLLVHLPATNTAAAATTAAAAAPAAAAMVMVMVAILIVVVMVIVIVLANYKNSVPRPPSVRLVKVSCCLSGVNSD